VNLTTHPHVVYVFWAVTPYCLRRQYGGNMDLENVGILPQHYTLKMEAAWISEMLSFHNGTP